MTGSADVVRGYLRAQNLEQLGRIDEALELYEMAVEASFDAAGPYDRLISLYAASARHGDVVRVATAAIANVRTHAGKIAWYEQMRDDARASAARVPRAEPRGE